MNEQLQRYMDGDISFEELPPEQRARALRWQARVDGMREGAPRGMPAGLEARVMRAVEREAHRPAWRRAVDWMLRPRSVSVSPLAATAGVAAIVLLFMAPWRSGPAPAASGGAGAGAQAGTAVAASNEEAPDVIVEFILDAPAARSVSVAGDFSTWSPAVELQDPDGDGVWSGRMRLQPGVHHYMFVIDGSEWVTDPQAARHADDGFGNRNAVLVVPGASRS